MLESIARSEKQRKGGAGRGCGVKSYECIKRNCPKQYAARIGWILGCLERLQDKLPGFDA